MVVGFPGVSVGDEHLKSCSVTCAKANSGKKSKAITLMATWQELTQLVSAHSRMVLCF